jgi:hypothetical protein
MMMKAPGKKKAKSTIKKGNMKKKAKDLIDLEKEELSGSDYTPGTNYSDTDEDENEGLGDGNIGKDVHDLFDK